jgi:hypothetical protein
VAVNRECSIEEGIRSEIAREAQLERVSKVRAKYVLIMVTSPIG